MVNDFFLISTLICSIFTQIKKAQGLVFSPAALKQIHNTNKNTSEYAKKPASNENFFNTDIMPYQRTFYFIYIAIIFQPLFPPIVALLILRLYGMKSAIFSFVTIYITIMQQEQSIIQHIRHNLIQTKDHQVRVNTSLRYVQLRIGSD